MERFYTDKLDSHIADFIKNTSKLKFFVDYVLKFIDRNNEILFDIGPSYRLVFSDADREFVYNLLKITSAEVIGIIKQSSQTKSLIATNKIDSKAFLILLTCILRKLTIAKKDTEMKTCLIYLTFQLYSSTHFKFFRYEPEKAIMDYTINHLSNKYGIKQVGSVYKALSATAIVNSETYKSKLVNGDDFDIVYYINALKTRIDGLIKNISKEFYNNHKNRKFMNYESDNTDENNYHMANSDIFELNKMVNNVILKMVTSGPDFNLIQISSKACCVSETEIRNTIIKLLDDDKQINNIKLVIENILELFLIEYKFNTEYVGTSKFYYECMNIYRKSNTNDTSILKIKDILDTWLKEYSATYKKTNRSATISDYRRALYMYFTLVIETNAN